MENEVKVFAPASVANVAVGYDILGFALDGPGDEIVVRFTDEKGFRIRNITGDHGKLPYDIHKNTAGFAAYCLLEHLGETHRGIEMEIHKKMPFGSGLGSSAASAAAGVWAVNKLLGSPLSKREVLHFAVLGEQKADGAYHADNVAPALLGGMVLIRNNKDLDVHQLPVPDGLIASVIYPHIKILTKEARGVLAPNLPLPKMIQQCGNLAGMIIGLYQSDFDLIGRSLKDVVIEPQRAQLIPHFYEVKKAALAAGALGCSISGAGPSIFALSQEKDTAERIVQAMAQVFQNHEIKVEPFVSSVNQSGAVTI
jgi:homoserine kinase